MKWEDYLMPHTDVLKNNFDLYNQYELDMMERRFTKDSIKNLLDQNVTGYTLDAYKAIHRDIFKDVYPEDVISGQIRKVGMAKLEPLLNDRTVEYCPPLRIETFASRALSNISQIDFSDQNDAIKALSREATELWVAHPFREGNTRTLAVFMKQVANSNNVKMDFSKLNENHNFRDSFVYAYAGDYTKIEKILGNAMNNATFSGDFSVKSKSNNALSGQVPGINKNEVERANQASSPSRKLK